MRTATVPLAAIAVIAACNTDDSGPSATRAATHLAFLTQPDTATAQVPFDPPVRVVYLDAHDTIVTDDSAITLTLAANPDSATFGGTATVLPVAGIATFSDLTLDRSGDRFVLQASSHGLPLVTTAPFSVRLRLVQVSAGDFHTCGTTAAGFAYCWGSNGQGKLGIGTNESGRRTPSPVTGALQFLQVSAGATHTCGLTTNGAAYCWGGNDAGGLGDGTISPRLAPTPVQGTFTFTKVGVAHAVLAGHTCALATDSTGYCWGNNDNGRLGDSTNTGRSSPTPVFGGRRFLQMSVGASHTCGVGADSVAYCWGQNYWGEVGDSTTADRWTPTPVMSSVRFVQISAGSEYTCGIATDSAAYCWGANPNGQLGDGTPDQRLIPTLVTGAHRFVQISAGSGFTCAVASNHDGYCWGGNDAGQLGDGTKSPQPAPTLVVGGLQFARISAGFSHACGMTVGNIAYCWGLNNGGQFGDSTLTDSSAPRRVRQ